MSHLMNMIVEVTLKFMFTLVPSFTDDASAKDVSRVRNCLTSLHFKSIYLLNVFTHRSFVYLVLLGLSKKAGSVYFLKERKSAAWNRKIGCKTEFPACWRSSWSSYFCHLPTVGPDGAQVSVRHTQVNPRPWGTAFKHKWRIKATPKVIWTHSASSICLQTGCGRIEAHGGRNSSAPLSLSSFAHPLCRRRNRRLWPRTWREVCHLHNRTLKPNLNCAVRQASNQSCGTAVGSFHYHYGLPGLESATEIVLEC